MSVQFSPEKVANPLNFRPVKSTNSLSNINYFTPEQILLLKPDSIPESAQLKTPGFVNLLNLFDGVTVSNRGRPNNLPLRVHDNRFIPSHKRDKYIKDEVEKRKYKIQTCLNRLNFKNTDEIIQELDVIKESTKGEAFKESLEQVTVELLLHRATSNDDSPEKNSHLYNFANLAILMSARNNEFKQICRSLTLIKYNELVKTEIPLNKIECLMVWISYLVMGHLIKRKEYFKCLELAIKNQPRDNAVDIIRSSFYTCGKFLDDQNWTESSTFYRILQSHNYSSGYLGFLSSELVKIRSANWNTKHYVKKSDQQTTTQPTTPGKKFADLKEKLLEEYTEWHSDPSYGNPHPPSNADLVDIIHASLDNYVSNVQKLQPEIEDYSCWLSMLVGNCDFDTKKIPSLLKTTSEKIKMRKELIPDFFTFVGAFYASKLINFKAIVEFGALEKSEYIDAIGKMTCIDQNEIREVLAPQKVEPEPQPKQSGPKSPLRQSASAPLYKNVQPVDIDEKIMSALVSITDWSDSSRDDTTYDKCVNFSRIVFAALEEADDTSKPHDVFDKIRQSLIDSAKKLPKALVSNIWKKALSTSLMSPEFLSEADVYFNELQI